MANPFSAYLESRVLTASPLQLVHLAYEGAIEAIVEARGHLAGKRITDRVTALTKAQKILIELQTSLNVEQGGELGKQLARLYEYMQVRLNDGNFKQADEPFAEVQGLLETLDEGWKEIAAADTTVVTAAAASSSSYGAPNSSWMTADEPVYSRSGYTL